MKVPFFGKDRYYRENREKILDLTDRIYSTGQVLQGPEVEEFEANMAGYCGRNFGLAVGSCTDALYFSLSDAGIKQGDEVLVTGFSFVASASGILKLGATPIFVDINPRDFMMDFGDLERKITSRTRAIIGVHLFGDMFEAERLEGLATEHGLILVEDSAQSIGASLNGRKAGSVGDYSCISFDPTKLLSAQSNAGIVLTDDINAFDRLSQLRYHGKNQITGNFDFPGFNSRVSSLQAAILSFNLTQLDAWVKRHRQIAHQYEEGLADLDILTPLLTPGHVYHKYVVQSSVRDELRDFLSSNGIQAKIHYDKTLSQHPLFLDAELPVANSIAEEVLSLPIHAWLREEEVAFVIEKIRDFSKLCL